MPIDADAYMSGAIPTLSRGGSWVPAAHPGHPANGTANPTATHLPSQTQSQGQPNPSIQGGPANMLSSWGTPMFFPGSGGFGGVAANGSVRGGGAGMGGVVYPGWKSNVGGGMNGLGGARGASAMGSVVGGEINGMTGGVRASMISGVNMAGGYTGGGMMSSASDVGRVAAFKAMSNAGRHSGTRRSVPETLKGGVGGAGGVGEGYDIEHGVGEARETAGIGKMSPIVGGIENLQSHGIPSVIPPKSASTVYPHRRPHMGRVPSTAPAVTARDMAYHQATPSVHSASVHSPTTRKNRQADQSKRDMWEDGAGSPVLIPREPDHNQRRQPFVPASTATAIPVVHRKRADSLPRVPAPGTEVIWSETPSGKSKTASNIDLEGRKREQMVADRRDRQRDEEHRPAVVTSGFGRVGDMVDTERTRPELQRRHSNESLLPAIKQSGKGTIDKSTVPEPVNFGPKNRHLSKKSPPTPPSPYIKLGVRPGLSRRNTHEPVSPPVSASPPSTASIRTTQFYAKRARHRSQPNLAHSSNDSATSSTSVHHTKLPSPPSPVIPPSPSRVHRQSRYDMSVIHSALPTAFPEGPIPTTGYIAPSSNEGYDRYASHPAAPVPDRVDRHIVATPPGNTALAPPTQPPPGMGGDTIILSQGGASNPGIAHGQEYLPIGYARPLVDMEWNRDGPAMKTYGVAWKRHQEGMVLPDGPQGPRWDVARPPRDSMVSSGGWWLSGGE